MYQKISTFIQSHFASLCIAFLLIGVMAGEPAADMAPIMPWLMAVFMFSSGLGLRLQDLVGLREKPWLLPVILGILHVLIPLISLGISTALRFPIEVTVGLALLAIIPISATSLVWIAVHRGNLTLCMAFILADTLFAPCIIPYMLDILFGTQVDMDPLSMLSGLFRMLFFPTILAVACNRVSNGGLQRIAGPALALLSRLAIYGIIAINGGIVAPLFQNFDLSIFFILGTVFLFCAFWFVFTFFIGLLLFKEKADIMAFMLGASIRGTSTGMIIATTYFSPLTALTVVFNMLFQQPLGAWFGSHAQRWLDKRDAGKNAG